MTEQIFLIIVTALVTSAGSALATVVGLRVHIDYIRARVELDHQEHRDEFKRVHRRIDEVQERITERDCRFPPNREQNA